MTAYNGGDGQDRQSNNINKTTIETIKCDLIFLFYLSFSDWMNLKKKLQIENAEDVV